MLIEGVVSTARQLGYLAHYSRPQYSVQVDGGFPALVLASGRRHRVVVALLLPDDGAPTLGEDMWLTVLGAIAHVERVVWRPADLLSGECERYLR